MRLFDLTFDTPEQNLACDEALLLDTDAGDCLRLWEPAKHFVVLGRSSRYAEEVDAPACSAADIPLLRRVSGGATIVAGPGCLMYAVVLDLTERPELLDLTRAHRHVLKRMESALRPLEPSVTHAGTSDLAIRCGESLRKFAGNSVRRVRNRLLYHGALLYDFDLPLIGRLLRTAPRQPEYRDQRDHLDFVANLPATRYDMVQRIAAEWSAVASPPAVGLDEAMERLIAEKYARPDWNLMR